MNIPESKLLFPTSESVSIYVIEKYYLKKKIVNIKYTNDCARVSIETIQFFFGSRGQPTHSCTVKNFIFVYESDAKR